MAPHDGRQRLLIKAAQLYYEDELTQEDIATRLHLSRSKVVRLLQEARREGIVQIRVVVPQRTSFHLERRIERCFDLQQAVVVESASLRSEEIRAAVGREAALVLAENLRSGDVLAMSSGTTLAATVDAMAPQRTPNVTIVEIEGSPNEDAPLPEYSTYELATRLAKVIGAQYRMIPVPREMGSPEAASIVRADTRIQRTLDLARHANILLIGVAGTKPLSPTLRHLTADILDQLEAAGAIGEIAARFFDATGRPCRSPLDERSIGLELGDLLNIPVRIGATFGLHKVPGIAGALQGRYLNILVTDSQTATALLTYAPNQEMPGPDGTARIQSRRHHGGANPEENVAQKLIV